jgi:lipopolysaccharide export system protein LptA
MKIFLNIFFIFLFTFSSFHVVMGQDKNDRVQLERGGEYMQGSERKGEKYTKFIGSPTNQVVFKQKNTTITGDSVYYFKTTNLIEVYGNVKIVEGAHITITGKKLIYDGNVKLAKMRDNVVYRDTTMTLYTNYLDYDMPSKLAYYQENGRIVDSDNVLTSRRGSFHTETKMAAFKRNVKLVNPEYILTSDTLQYNTYTKIAYTKGPTEITYKDGTIINSYEEGEYNTRQEKTKLGKGVIETPNYYLKGDRLFFDDANKYYSASSNVVMISKKDDVVITGDQARYWKPQGLTKIWGEPVMKKLVQADTFFLSADTLVSIESETGKDKKLLAYEKVKMFKSDLQGKADSLSYNFSDSTIYFYRDPVLWTQGGNQMAADSIHITLVNNQIDKLFMNNNSFVISQDTIKNFNQVKGRKMIAHFRESDLHKIDVNGNSQLIYYSLEMDTVTMGLNKIECSDMILRFLENKINNISMYKNPSGLLVPPHEITAELSKLDGFNWREKERPTKIEVVGTKKRPFTPEENNFPKDIKINDQEIKRPGARALPAQMPEKSPPTAGKEKPELQKKTPREGLLRGGAKNN